MGFHFNTLGQSITCSIKFSNFDASCEFGGKFFTALAQAAQWVFKTAEKLFDESGKVVMAVAQGIGKFSLNAAKSAVQLAKDTYQTVKNAANFAIQAAREQFNRVKDAAVQVFNAAKDYAQRTFNNIVDGLRELAERARREAQNAVRRVRRFFSWSALIDKVESESYEGLGLSKKALAQIKKVQLELRKTLAKLKDQESDAARNRDEQIRSAEQKRDNEIQQAQRVLEKREFEENTKVRAAEEEVNRLDERIKRLERR